MDSEQRTNASNQQDADRCAKVIRAISDVEADAHFAWGALSERLMQEVGAAFRVATPDTWIVEADENGATAMESRWRANRGVNQRDAWLELGDLTEADQAYSWAAVIAGAGQTQLCLELKFRPGLVPVVQAMKDKEPAIVALVKAGFQKDATNRFYMPIKIAAEGLALGLLQNDLDDAFMPLREAVGIAVSKKAELDALIEHVRTEAKRK